MEKKKSLARTMVVYCYQPNVCLMFIYVIFLYATVRANSYIGDTENMDYEIEDTPSHDQLSPSLSLSLKRILRNTYQQLPASLLGDSDPSSADRLEAGLSKRSRFYRKYPGKRQNRHYNDMYDCTPSSTETVRLLYAIHQARLGDIEHIVFCNRLRNPKGIIPNPRYVGKRGYE